MSGFKERHYDYLRDPEAIYARSFDTIRTEADLSRFTADEADVATRIIHACGMVDVVEDLRFSRAGQHFVVFVEDIKQVIIIDFLHSRTDLPRRLANLPLPKGGGEH